MGSQKKVFKDLLVIKKLFCLVYLEHYTSTCSAKHLPGYVANADKIKAKGIDQIYFVFQ